MKKEYQELKTPMGMLYVVDERDEVEIYDSDRKFMDFIADNFYKTIIIYQNLTKAEDLVNAGIFPNAMWNVNKEELIQDLKDYYEEMGIEPNEPITEDCLNRIGNVYVCYLYDEL